MRRHVPHRPDLWLILFFLLIGFTSSGAAEEFFPEDHHALTETISYARMRDFLQSINGVGPITVSQEGTTAQSRSIFLVRAARGKNPSFRILFYAQQHGDEVSGKDALLFLIRDIVRNPKLLSRDVDLWILPMMNPDGAEAGTRRNGSGADLNRDHIVLEQPETQALHRIVRRIRPHLAVDCHEFVRDSEARRHRGWLAWPDITMDILNNPLFDPSVITAARRWLDESKAAEAKAGHTFYRYTVGGLPPDEEQRHSAPDVDSGLNAVGMYGGLSFIIEAAALRETKDLPSDLPRRIDAYLVLLRRFLQETPHRRQDVDAVETSRKRSLPPFLPTNYLWVNPGQTITEFPVLDAATGRTLHIPTANLMTTLAVKTSVPTPLAYVVDPSAASEFKVLLDRHGIPYEEFNAPRMATVESCTLVRMEDEFDDLYSRYEGRQIVTRGERSSRELPPGSLWVPLQGEAAVRAALLLEPSALYGVYQYPRFRPFAVPGKPLPVLRIVN